MPTPTELLTIREVAALCKVTPQAVYIWIKERGLPTLKLGARMRIRRSELDQWMTRGRAA